MAAHRAGDPRRFLAPLVLLVMLVPAAAAAPSMAAPPQSDGKGWCIVCNAPATAGAMRETFKGRTIQVCNETCRAQWNAHRDELFASLQARGALFDETAINNDGHERSLLSGWMWFGIYVVAGLVCGALAAYAALGRGLAPLPWLLAGLAFNVVALGLLATRPRGDLSQLPQGVPDGLRKIAMTHAPAACPKCGRQNHPSATACADCGALLQARFESEPLRLQKKRGANS